MRDNNGNYIYPGEWVLADGYFLGVITSFYSPFLCNIIIFSDQVLEIRWFIQKLIEVPKNEIPLYAKQYLNIIHSFNYHKFLFNTNLKARFIDNKLLTKSDLFWLTQNE